MNKLFSIFVVFVVCFPTEIHAQLFDVLNKPMYEARVKLLDEFYARFNGKEQRKGVDVKYTDRKSNIMMLLDFSRFKSREDSAFIFAEAFAGDVIRDSIMVNYTDSCWFAKVKCHGVLAKKGVDFLLYLSIEKRGKDMYKWVISDVEGNIFSTSRSIDHRELFLHPNDHEQSFVSLVRTTEETSRYIDDFVKDGYECDALSIFLTLVRCGQLKIDYVSDVEFVYLQVPEYIFSVKHFERETMNAGWLISSIEKCNEAKKTKLLSRLHSTSFYETVTADTPVIETEKNSTSHPETPIIQKDTVPIENTAAEKTVRRFWNNIKFWCDSKDPRFLEDATEACAGRRGKECLVNDDLMIEFAPMLGLEQQNTYMLQTYLRIFQHVFNNDEGNEPLGIIIGEIKEIECSKEWCIVSCCIKIKGAINADLKDYFYVRRNGKVSKITSTKPTE